MVPGLQGGHGGAADSLRAGGGQRVDVGMGLAFAPVVSLAARTSQPLSAAGSTWPAAAYAWASRLHAKPRSRR